MLGKLLKTNGLVVLTRGDWAKRAFVSLLRRPAEGWRKVSMSPLYAGSPPRNGDPVSLRSSENQAVAGAILNGSMRGTPQALAFVLFVSLIPGRPWRISR